MSTLVSRTITVDGRSTSIELDPTIWDALQEICDRDGISIDQFCTQVDRKGHESPLAAAVHAAVLMYWRLEAITGADPSTVGAPTDPRQPPGGVSKTG